MAQDTGYIRDFLSGIRDERRTHANTATRIGTALLLLLDYLASIDHPYLRKDADDTAEGVITFLRGLLLGDGSYAISADGLARLRSAVFSENVTTGVLEVNGWARFEKLVYNMLQLQEQDMLLSGGGDVERVIDNHDGTYTLVMHKESEDRHAALAEYDILKGKVSEPLPSGSSATEYTSWMRVCQDGVTLRAEARVLIGTSDVTDDVLQRATAGTLDLSWSWERLSGECSPERGFSVPYFYLTSETATFAENQEL